MGAAATGVVVPGRRGVRQGATATAVAVSMLLASFGNFLGYHAYPMLRSEVALVAAGLLIAAALYGLWYAAAGRIGRAAAEGSLLFLAVDLNTDGAVLVGVALGLAVTLVRYRTGISLLPLLGTVAVVVFLTGLLGLGSRQPPLQTSSAPVETTSADRPAILHIILDEHGGLASLPDERVKAAVSGLYRRHGFRLFDRAYSRHFHTVNAIPDILNFGSPGDSRKVSESLDIGRTAYLSGLEEQGYRLHFYQSEFADFCRYSSAASCTRYWSPSLAFVDPLDLPAREKARVIAYKLAGLSDLAVTLGNIHDHLAQRPSLREWNLPRLAVKMNGLSGSLAAFETLDRLASDVRRARPSNVYFAHVLAPHYPYVVGPDCRTLPPSQWRYRRSNVSIEERERAYFGQVHCLARRLDRVFANFAASPGGASGIIVVHGDHGSRLTASDPNSSNKRGLAADDLMASYSTLFAVKSPSIAPGLEQRPFAVPELLAGLARSRFASLDTVSPGSGRVFLNGPGWTARGETNIAGAWPDTRLTQSPPLVGKARPTSIQGDHR